MLFALLAMTALALFAGILLALAARQMPASSSKLVEEVNALLPQTQCAQCGYPGCRPYAEAVVEHGEAINLCPPGGETTVQKLAQRLGRDARPLAAGAAPVAQVAVVDEARCIGCLHCRNACPVDAIVGAQNTMHTVIADECTGCELCIAPCPVDCIELKAAS
ncbi:MAG: electron transport complex subunit RsxB [Pseudomonadota bacterium]